MQVVARPGEDRTGGAGGFTVVDVLVVLCLVVLCASLAMPALRGYVEDGRRARAQTEARLIGDALLAAREDLGRFPARNVDGVDGYLHVLYSGPARVVTNPWTDNHQWSTWCVNPARGDRLDDHLLQNRPQGAADAGYPGAGERAWRGPYVPGSTPLDPWGRPYVVNVMSGCRSDAINYRRLWVVSAGPNGRFDTPFRAALVDEPSGDDVAVLLFERR